MKNSKPKYVEVKDLPVDVEAKFQEFLKLHAKAKKAEAVAKSYKEAQVSYKEDLVGYLGRMDAQGILGKSELAYMQESKSAPSFAQVLEAANVGKAVKAKLEAQYQSMVQSNGYSLRVKARVDQGGAK